MVRRMQESNNKRGLYESNSNLFGVRLYDPYSGEYVVYWSQDKNIVREIYDTLRDFTWIRYDDLYDFVDQINPKFNKFTWEDIGFEWDYGDAFIGDGVHESEGEIDIIYELPLDTKHYVESVRRKSKKSMNEREYRHYLSNNPTDYERLLNYVESFVHTCEITTDEAERYLRSLENNAEFYTDEKNSRWMGIDEKMNKISRLLEQVEKIRRSISKLGG